MLTNISKDNFMQWYSNGLKEYLDGCFRGQYTMHIEDLMCATTAYTEAVTAFIANKPQGI